MTLPEVVLFDGGFSCTLAALRALSARGIPCRVIDSNPRVPARFSRQVTGYTRCPPMDSDAFVDWLRQQFVSGAICRVLPTSDLLLYRLNQVRDVLPAAMRDSLPSESVLFDCLFKDRFRKACVQVGLKTPATWEPESMEALHALLPQLPYPVLVKPRSHVGIGLWERGTVVHDAGTLLQAFHPYAPPQGGGDELQAIAPGLQWPLIQQVLLPEQGGVHSVCGFRDPALGLQAVSTVVKLEQWPPDVGIGMVFEQRECAALEQQVGPALEALLDRGIFEIEFIRHAGEWYAIDCNPRVFGMIGLHCARGDDLPWLWYRSTLDAAQRAEAENQVPPPAAPQLRFWRCEVPFEAGYWTRLLNQPERSALWRRYRQRKQGVAAGPGWRDPWVQLLFAAGFLRHPRALVRPFWREAAQLKARPAAR